MSMISVKTNTIVVLVAMVSLTTQISNVCAQLIDYTEERKYERVASIATRFPVFAAELNITPRQKRELTDALSFHRYGFEFSMSDLQEGKGLNFKKNCTWQIDQRICRTNSNSRSNRTSQTIRTAIAI